MAREKELYRDTLERIRTAADAQFPGKLLLNQQEAARLMGISTRTLRRMGLTEFITCEQLARTFA